MTMDSMQIAIAIKPLANLAFFAIVVIPIELALKRIWPKGSVKNLLFDRTFQKRHPWQFGAAAIGANVLLWTWAAILICHGGI
jgi:hypothetical protein